MSAPGNALGGTGGRTRAGVRAVLLRAGVPVVAVALWQAVTLLRESVYFPTPARIVAHAWRLWFDGPASRLFLTDDAVDNVLPSVGRVLAGFGIAAAGGIVLGLLLGRSRTAYALCDPLLQFARAVPPPALVPVAVVLFDLGTPMQLSAIVFSAVWPVLINTAEGVRAVEPLRLDVAAVLRMPVAERVRLLYLPAALPRIFAGLRLSLALSLILMVFSELLPGTANGVGFQLVDAQTRSDLLTVWAVLLLLGALGHLLNSALQAVERLVGPYAYRGGDADGTDRP